MTNINKILSKHPASLNISSRCDHRTIAALAIFWQASGEGARSISEVVRVSLETFAELLQLQKKAPLIESHEQALSILRGLSMNIPKRSARMLAKELSKESLKVEGFKQGDILGGQKSSIVHPLIREAQLATGREELESEEDALERREEDQQLEKDEMEKLLKGGE